MSFTTAATKAETPRGALCTSPGCCVTTAQVAAQCVFAYPAQASCTYTNTLLFCHLGTHTLLFCPPAAPDQLHGVPALENDRHNPLLRGVLSPEPDCGTADLLGGTSLAVPQLCAIFSSPPPHSWLEAPAAAGRG